MSSLNTKALPGFTELLPEDQAIFDDIKERIEETYRSYGFMPLSTPSIERKEILFANAGGDTEKEIYEFKKGDTEVALRYDLTVPLARYVAENRGKLIFPFKRYEIGKVYRGERPQKGRSREFFQADIDIVGFEKLDIVYDAEVIKVINSVFENLDFGKFVIRINNRKVLTGLFEEFGLKEKSAEAMRIMDKLEKVGQSEVLKMLVNLGIEKDIAKRILEFTSFKGSGELCINHLKDREINNETFMKGLMELEQVCKALRNFGVTDENFQVDLSIARGLDYYTGTVFETSLIDYPEIGSVCSGGRYDNLTDNFSNKKMPGVGASIGLNRLFSQLKDAGILQKYIKDQKFAKKVLILPLIEESKEIADVLIKEAYKISETFMAKKMITQVDSREIKMKKKFDYANKIGADFVVVLGEEELKNKSIKLKNMDSGEEESIEF